MADVDEKERERLEKVAAGRKKVALKVFAILYAPLLTP